MYCLPPWTTSPKWECPYCFENVDIYVDPETQGELIQDCDVCCRPWVLRVSRGADGSLVVHASRAQ